MDTVTMKTTMKSVIMMMETAAVLEPIYYFVLNVNVSMKTLKNLFYQMFFKLKLITIAL